MIHELIDLQKLEQLSECPYAMLLGLNTDNNLIERYLDFSRKLLGVQHAVLCFLKEPLLWCSNDQGLFATTEPLHQLESYLRDTVLMTPEHPRYAEFCQHMTQLGMPHARCVALKLCQSNDECIAFVLFYDDLEQPVETGALDLLLDYSGSFMRHIEMKFHFEELRHLYEEQCAQNFSKTKFFSIISHDLRAPFHGLLGFSEILAKERQTLDESSIQNISDYLYDTAQSTYNLLESLLNWAMAEGGRFVYHPVSFKLKQASGIVCQVLNSLAVKKQIQLLEDVPEDIQLYADINMTTSLLQNLVSNALKFTPTDGAGVVRISARVCDDAHVEICISDNGLGMTQTQLVDVFQPQINVSFKGTAGEKGTGLGLTLCKRFVDLNHGQISVASQEGHGTTFKVILPAAAQHIEHSVQTTEQVSTQGA